MKDVAHEYTDKQIKKLNKQIQRVYSEAQKDIEKKLDTFIQKLSAKADIKYQDLINEKITKDEYTNWMRGQVFQMDQWKAKRDQIVETIHNSNNIAVNIINGNMNGVFAENATYMNYLLEHGAGVNFGFGVYDNATVARLAKDNPQMLPKWKINEKKDYIWNEKKVNNAITQGIIQGEKLDQISKRVSDGLVMQNENLSKTFARTAMTEAQNAGRLESLTSANDMGIEVNKQWMATLDNHTRDSHADIDGESIPEDEEFSNGLKYPGDPSGDASEIYNCRCTMVGDLKKYPAEYERYDNIDGMPIRSMTYKEWSSFRRSQSITNVHINLPTSKQFKQTFNVAKSTIPKSSAWRVDDTYTVEDYKHKKLIQLDGKSVVAISNNGDIVSVCKNMKGSDRGSDLLKVAVANGGDRLDAFGGGLYEFYTKNGFEPVSWTRFNEKYAPHDWVKGRDAPEPVIFYRYTGKQTKIPYDKFIEKTTASSDYNKAKNIRDKLIDKKHKK